MRFHWILFAESDCTKVSSPNPHSVCFPGFAFRVPFGLLYRESNEWYAMKLLERKGRGFFYRLKLSGISLTQRVRKGSGSVNLYVRKETDEVSLQTEEFPSNC